METKTEHLKVEQEEDFIDLGLSEKEEVKDPNLLPAGVTRYLHVDTENGGMVVREEGDHDLTEGLFYRCYKVANAEVLGQTEFIDASQYDETEKKYPHDYLPVTSTRYYMKTTGAIKLTPLGKNPVALKTTITRKYSGCR